MSDSLRPMCLIFPASTALRNSCAVMPARTWRGSGSRRVDALWMRLRCSESVVWRHELRADRTNAVLRDGDGLHGVHLGISLSDRKSARILSATSVNEECRMKNEE